MPRDKACMIELRKAVVDTFDKLWKEHCPTKSVSEVYGMVSSSPAPSFFLTFEEALRIVWRFSNKGFVERKKDLTHQRDVDFINAYCKLRLENSCKSKDWAIWEATLQPAPRFYINKDMVASIVLNQNKRKRCTQTR